MRKHAENYYKESRCLYCKKIFQAYVHNLRKGFGKYCSRGCSNRANKLGFRLGHPMFSRVTPLEVVAHRISKAKKGKKLGIQHKKSLSLAKFGKYQDDKSPNWKGDGVGYSGLHYWVRKHLGKPDRCEFCHVEGLKGRQIHWANKSRKYKRDLGDWLRLCKKCHEVYDHKKSVICQR